MEIFQQSREKLKYIYLYILSLFFVLSFAIYFNVLHGEFISDDYVTIVNNPAVRHIGNFKAIWDAFSTRFLVGYTFALNYFLGGLNVFWYHFVNIVMHTLNSFLVFSLIMLSSKTHYFRRTGLHERSFTLALLSSLLFLCHPIQTQAVSFITQRAVLMGTFFYLSTLMLYIKFRLTGHNRYFVFAIITMFLGLFSKENIFTLPLVMFIYEVFFIEKNSEKLLERLKNILPFLLIVLFLPLIILQDRTISVLSLGTQLERGGFSLNYFFTEIEALCKYLGIVLFPLNQNHHYDFPVSTGLFDPATLISAISLFTLFVLGILFIKKDKLAGFCIFWFFITTSVEAAAVTFVHRKVIDEHWFYLPMVGVCILIAYVIIKIFKGRKDIVAVSIIILLILSLLSYKRNKVWQTEIGFWNDVLKKSPYIEWPYIGAGKAYARKGFYGRAERLYAKGLKFNPDSPLLLNEMGVIFARKNLYPLALQYFEKAIKYNPDFAKAYNNLAYTYYLNGNFKRALEYYDKSLKVQGGYADGFYYKGQCCLALGQKEKALGNFKKALAFYEKEETQSRISEINQIIHEINNHNEKTNKN